MALEIKDFQCPSCGGPLIVFRGSVNRKNGVFLACKETVDGPESCPDATGICLDLQEALGYLLPGPVEPTLVTPVEDVQKLREHVRILREALIPFLDATADLRFPDGDRIWHNAANARDATKEEA